MQRRKALPQDLPRILQLITSAKQWMTSKNGLQWPDFYPNKQIIEDDIKKGYSYVLVDKDKDDGKIICTFAMVPGLDPFYENVVEGAWLYGGSNYVVCTRGAIDYEWKGKGIGKIMMDQIVKIAKQGKFDSIKASTNDNNTRVLQLLVQNGYKYCGKIPGIRKNILLIYQHVLMPLPSL